MTAGIVGQISSDTSDWHRILLSGSGQSECFNQELREFFGTLDLDPKFRPKFTSWLTVNYPV